MSSAANLALSIVIPAYNEAARLPPNLLRIAGYCDRLDFAACGLPGENYEVIVVVERSLDRTLEESRASAAGLAHVEVIDNQVQRGKGYAVRTGMLRARGQIVFFMDADLSTPLEEVELFLRYFAEHADVDVLIGNRRHPASHVRRPQGRMRRVLSQVFSSLVRRQALSAAGRDNAVRVQGVSPGGGTRDLQPATARRLQLRCRGPRAGRSAEAQGGGLAG